MKSNNRLFRFLSFLYYKGIFFIKKDADTFKLSQHFNDVIAIYRRDSEYFVGNLGSRWQRLHVHLYLKTIKTIKATNVCNDIFD